MWGLLIKEFWRAVMYAVIKNGGFQYRVTKGQVIRLQKVELELGAFIDVEAMAVGNGTELKIGQPIVAGSKVRLEVINHQRGKKITTIKLKRRKHHIKKIGHRQWYTFVRVAEIVA
jgi:large subunit ribosomal protein L21